MSENQSLYMTLGAAAAGTIVGIGAMFMAQNHEKQTLKNQKIARIKERKKKYLEKKIYEDFIKDTQDPVNKKQKRRVHLYFDENDQMVEREEDEQDLIEQAKNSQPKELDVDDLKKRLQKLKTNQSFQNYKAKITVNLGNEEYDIGQNKIQHDLFDGNNKTQNAELFIENLEKNILRHKEEAKQPIQQQEKLPRKMSGNDKSGHSMKRTLSETDMDPIKKMATNKAMETDDVIMDLNPENFTKKDAVFMDFFSLYGKNFIDQKKEIKKGEQVNEKIGIETPGQKKSSKSQKSSKPMTGQQTPFDMFLQQYSKEAQRVRK